MAGSRSSQYARKTTARCRTLSFATAAKTSGLISGESRCSAELSVPPVDAAAESNGGTRQLCCRRSDRDKSACPSHQPISSN